MTHLTKLREICDAATPGPWWEDDQIWAYGKDGADIIVCHPESSDANADFIATFNPTMIGKLLDLWEAAKESEATGVICFHQKEALAALDNEHE